MPTYTQDGRPMRIDTPLGPDELLLLGFTGTEALSEPFAFTVDLLSEKPDIAAADLLRQACTLTLLTAEGEKRFLHGCVRRFVQAGRVEGLTAYRAELVPAVWFLSLKQDCRIFQRLSVLEIIEQVFGDAGFTGYTLKTTKSYPKRDYCVQYRESPFAFVSRLMEEEGIWYCFEHGDGRHTMIIADAPGAVKPCPIQAKVRITSDAKKAQAEDVVLTWERGAEAATGKVALTDYEPLTPTLDLGAQAAGEGDDERFDYPGGYATLDEGNRYAGLRLEALEADPATVTGTGTARTFSPGFKFELREHYRRDQNAAYLLTSVRHQAKAGDVRSWSTAPFDYTNRFTAMPAGVPYRPPHRTPRPSIPGTQPAVVTGPDGEEIYVDKYGRVKVQFFWDRYGRKNEDSSCWIRFTTSWAGKTWGAIRIPRIGQEVIVGFLEGDPDQPIIVGSVYNAEQMPPYELPANMTQSGVKSRSTKSGSGQTFNEIRFEDKKGSELLYVHAEKDRTAIVENDNSESVGHDEAITVGHDRTRSVGNDESVSIGHDQTVTVGNDRTESVGHDEAITIGNDRTHTVGRDQSYSTGRDRARTVGRDETATIGRHLETTVAKNETRTVGDNQTVTVGKDGAITIGKKLVIDVGDEITIKTGQASIVMKKNGEITIKGKDISIDGSGKINVKASSDVVIKGSKVGQN
jgi:type VI secretion system secreted protein VgrG